MAASTLARILLKDLGVQLKGWALAPRQPSTLTTFRPAIPDMDTFFGGAVLSPLSARSCWNPMAQLSVESFALKVESWSTGSRDEGP
jgi:hypothetical protein